MQHRNHRLSIAAAGTATLLAAFALACQDAGPFAPNAASPSFAKGDNKSGGDPKGGVFQFMVSVNGAMMTPDGEPHLMEGKWLEDSETDLKLGSNQKFPIEIHFAETYPVASTWLKNWQKEPEATDECFIKVPKQVKDLATLGDRPARAVEQLRSPSRGRNTHVIVDKTALGGESGGESEKHSLWLHWDTDGQYDVGIGSAYLEGDSHATVVGNVDLSAVSELHYSGGWVRVTDRQRPSFVIACRNHDEAFVRIEPAS